MESNPVSTKDSTDVAQQSTHHLQRSMSVGGSSLSSNLAQQAQSQPNTQLQQSQSTIIQQQSSSFMNPNNTYTSTTGYSRPMGGNTYGYINNMGFSRG